MRKALFALGQSVGRPTEKREGSRPDKASALPRIGGRSYYFLWSLERVAVALGLKTIGKKDWYSWGAEILLANQEPDGSWKGFYGESGADTCFALLFLKQANLVPDLTTQLAGRVQDPGERALKGGDLRDMFAREKSGDFVSGIEGKGGKPPRDGQHPDEIAKNRVPNVAGKDPAPLPATRPEPPPPKAEKPPAKKAPAPDAPSSTTERMAEGLAKSNGSRFSLLLHNYRIGKGAEFTEVLALAIPQMSGARQRETREALTGRLTRMKDTTLKEYLADENLEIRIAAARACAKKGSKGLIPYLIPLLRDSRGGMAEAAHHALKDLTGQDFGPKPNSNRDERVEASRQWAEWWKKQEVKKDNPRESPAKRQ